MNETLLWSPFHISHNFMKYGIFKTYLGVFYLWKCNKCGDLKFDLYSKRQIRFRNR